MGDGKRPGVSGAARLAGVMGWPVTHSRSPRLHGYWLNKYGIDGLYAPMAVSPERLETALRALPALGFRGVNLTAPLKERALRLVDEADEAARRIGAVNTIIVDGERLLGRNTDAFGFAENLRHQAPQWRADAGPALVIGAGGAARAVVAALQDLGVDEVRVVNRTTTRAAALTHDLGGIPWMWEERTLALKDVSLLVNTTTQGMAGSPALDLPLDHLPVSAVVADIVYTPLVTPLLAAAQARGRAIVDGLGMLIHQARPGFAAWFGVMPEADADLRALLLADLTA